MPNQTAGNVLAALKRQPDIGTAAAAGAGAEQIRLVDSPGLGLARSNIESGERRRDQLRNMGRLGGKNVDGSYNTEVTIGGAFDMLLESIARGTWSAVISTALGATDGTTTASTIVRASGSWLTDGFREGDVVTITGDTTTANNDLRLMVVSVTATTITVAGSPLTANATARAFTVARLKKVINPAIPVYHSYSIEQYDMDIDRSELFTGVRLTQLALALRPNGMATAGWTFSGLDRQIIEAAAAPYFTDPAVTTGLPLISDDAGVYYKGEQIAVLTGLDLTFTIAAALQPVIGSFVSPDVFMNEKSITGSLTAVREDLAALSDFDNETEFAIGAILTAPSGTPEPAIGVYLPRVKISGIDAPFLGGDAAKVETRNLMLAPHAGDADTDATAVVFSSSAA